MANNQVCLLRGPYLQHNSPKSKFGFSLSISERVEMSKLILSGRLLFPVAASASIMASYDVLIFVC